jgi:hypothetical protein
MAKAKEFIVLYNLGHEGYGFSELDVERTEGEPERVCFRIKNPRSGSYGLSVVLDSEQTHQLADLLKVWAGPMPDPPLPKWRRGK